MSLADLLTSIAAVAWLILALYGFFSVRKWNRRFSELYEELKREVK